MARCAGEFYSVSPAKEKYKTENDVVSYVRAVEKGANDKKRRADRHDVMVKLLTPFFRARK